MNSSYLLTVRTALWLCLTLLASGCGDGSSSSSSPTRQTNSSSSEGSVITAPVDYLGAAAKAQRSAVKTVDLASVNQAVKMFQVEQGRFPKDLNELVQEQYLARIPAAPYGTKLVYDPATGQAKIVKQ